MKKFLILSLIGFAQLNVFANEYNFDYYGKTNSSNTPPDLDLSTFTEKELNTNFSRNSNGWLYTVNSETKESTLRSTQLPDDAEWSTVSIDPKTKRLFVEAGSEGSESVHIFDPVSNTWSTTCEDSSSYEWSDICDYKVPTGFEWDSSANSSIKVGNANNPTVINSNGISGIITRDGSTGITKIGQNSLNFQEFSGSQPLKLWGTNTSGEAVPINIVDSELQINGVSVQNQIDTNTSNISTNTSNISTNTSNISTNTSNISTNTSNIKNLGSGVAGSTALTAALTALPQTSKESKLSCGVGSGAYSSRYAVGFGCASKINERVDINAGGSYVFGGSKSYGGGTLDSGVVKAGFVFKLGELNKPTQISMKDKKVMETKIENLEEKNKQLLARLERLEKIALGESKSKDLAVYQLK